MLRWNCSLMPWMWRSRVCVSDNFQVQSVRIRKGKHFLFESSALPLHRNAKLLQPFSQIPEGVIRNTEGGSSRHSRPRTPTRGQEPGKKREDCSRRAHLIAEIKMIGLRVIKIDRSLHEP